MWNTALVDMTNSALLKHIVSGPQATLQATDMQEGETQAPSTPGFTLKRPHRNKKAKDPGKKQKIQEDTLVTQALAAKELTASIAEKTKFLKEQDIVALFSIKDNDSKLSKEGKEFFHLSRARDLALFKKSLESSKETHDALDASLVSESEDNPIEEGEG
jgi:hypothetical protein